MVARSSCPAYVDGYGLGKTGTRKYLGHQLVLVGLFVAPLVFLGNKAYQSIYAIPAEFHAHDVWWATDSDIRPVLPIKAPGLQPATARNDQSTMIVRS